MVLDAPGDIALLVSNGYCIATDTSHVDMSLYATHLGALTIDTCFAYGNVHVDLSSLLIFDRWGELIFEGGPGSIAWDGTYGGQPVQIDVYNYRYTYRPVIDAEGRSGREETAKGHVTVVR